MKSRRSIVAFLLAVAPPLAIAQAPASDATKPPRELCASFNRPGISSLAGIVRESDGKPIPFAVLNFDGGYTTTGLADRNGCFGVRAPRNAPLTANVRRIGYQPFSKVIDLRGDSTVFIDVHLASVAQTVEGVQVTAPRNDAMERTGFYDRMLERQKGLGDGYFITPEDIERRSENKISHLLEGYPNISVTYDAAGNGYPTGHGQSDPTLNGGRCSMSIWLDGSRIRTGSLDELVGPQGISAIEIYPDAFQTPPQYQTTTGDGACGAIVAWTQRPDFTRHSGNWFKENLLTIVVVPLLAIAIITSIGKHP